MIDSSFFSRIKIMISWSSIAWRFRFAPCVLSFLWIGGLEISKSSTVATALVFNLPVPARGRVFPILAANEQDQETHQCKCNYSYVALYKPALTLCSFRDDGPRAERKNRERRQTLADLGLPEVQGLHSCGRLDRDSEGLLLLTDDGRFTNDVCYHIDTPHNSTINSNNNTITINTANNCHKRYWVLVKGKPNEKAMFAMRQGGLLIRGVKTQPPIEVRSLDSIDIDIDTSTERSMVRLPTQVLPPACHGMDRAGSWLEITLNEGRHRQIRRVTAAAGHPTIRLVRVAVGNLGLIGCSRQDGTSTYASSIQNQEQRPHCYKELDLLQPGDWQFIGKEQVLAQVGTSIADSDT